MKVRELIEALRKCDADMAVYTDFENSSLVDAVVVVQSEVLAGEAYKDLPSYVELQ